MQKTFMIIGDPSCAGSDPIYVICSQDQIDGFMRESGYGCSECRSYQEVPMMTVDEVDYLITDKGTVFSRNSWRHLI